MFLRAYTPTSVFIVGDAPKDCSAALYVRFLDLCFTISSAASFVVDQNFILKKCGRGGLGGNALRTSLSFLVKSIMRLLRSGNFVQFWQFFTLVFAFQLILSYR